MYILFICAVCVTGAFAQQPGVNFNVNPGLTNNPGFVNPNMPITGINTNVNGFNPLATQQIVNPNLQNGVLNPAGFSTPFGPFRPNGRFGSTGLGGQVFGQQRFGSVIPPMSPIQLTMMSLAANPNNYRYATCTFNDTWSPVRGRADFRQFLIGEGKQQVNVRLQLSGLPTSVMEVERGIHIHEFGDSGDGCARVGPHFNPNQTPHGSQRNFAYLRHVGDLGNIRQSSEGMVSTQLADQVISLEGTSNVVGRSLVIKFERDDEGLGTTPESRVNGNTFNPVACCTIGLTTARSWYNPMSAMDIQNMASTGMMPDITNTLNNNINNVNNRGLNNNPGFNNINNVNTMGLNNNPGFNNINNVNTMGRNNNPGFNNINNNNMGFNNNPGFNNVNNLAMNPNNLNTNTNGLNQPGFNQPGATNFGSATFIPGATSGQTFNFGQSGKKK